MKKASTSLNAFGDFIFENNERITFPPQMFIEMSDVKVYKSKVKSKNNTLAHI